VIVFCQSEGCTWATHTGQMLLARGFRNVRRYPGGYAEWTAAHAKSK
jgi:3-mercaptopyruvate sulfurtransferase SseA